MIAIGEVLSRVRNQIKAVKQDAFLTDRFLYSMVMKHAKMLVRRQDIQNRIMKFNSVFQVLNYVELIEIDRAESQCHCITSGCTFKRTKNKLPNYEGFVSHVFEWQTLSVSYGVKDLIDLTKIYNTLIPAELVKITFKRNRKKRSQIINSKRNFFRVEKQTT